MSFPFLGRLFGSLRVDWSFSTERAGVVIWRLLTSPSAGIMTGEVRDIEAKTGSLFAIDLRAGRVLWRNRQPPEPWWFGSDRATARTLFLHGYPRPDLPEAAGITAFDLKTGAVRWSRPDLSIASVGEDTGGRGELLAMRQGFSHREYLLIDEETGEVIRTVGEDPSELFTQHALMERGHPAGLVEDDADHFSGSLPEGSAMHERFTRSIEAWSNGETHPADLRGSLEYLAFGRYEIYAYHTRAHGATAELNGLLTARLIVLRQGASEESGEAHSGSAARVVFRETIQRETPFPMPDTFFISHKTLIYVKDQCAVHGVVLR